MWLLIFIVALFLATIPANIASSKGKDYFTWYVYGFFLWIVAVIHAAALPYQQPIIVQSGNIHNLNKEEILKSDYVANGVVTEFDTLCPVEPVEWEIYTNKEIGYDFCKVKFRNLLKGNIRAIKFKLICFDAFGEPVMHANDNIFDGIIQDLNVPIKQIFGYDYNVKLHSDNVRNVNVIIMQVLFTNNDIWEKNDSNILNMPITTLCGQEIKDIKSIAGNDACCYPIVTDNHWVCVCGRYNNINTESCFRCGRDKSIVFDKFTKPSVEIDIQKIKLQTEENERLEKIQLQATKEKYFKTIKKILAIGVPVISVLSLSIFIYITFINPMIEYNKAIDFKNKQEYDNAIATFNKIINYKDANLQISEIEYNRAVDFKNKQEYDNAISTFNEIVDYKDSKQQILEIQYNTAIEFKINQKYNSAINTFRKIIDYKDSKQQILEIINKHQTICAGSNNTVGLRSDGTVVAVGFNGSGQCNVSDWKNIVSISADNHTVGLKTDGTVVAVGFNNDGQCNVSDWKDIIAISAGSNTVGLKSDGTVLSTGYYRDVSEWKDIVAISTGRTNIVGLKTDGTVVADGYNKDGQCNVSEWKDIIAISAGYGHTVGLKNDGTVVAVGINDFGQCNVSNWKDIVSISAGYWHTVGLTKNGSVIATGNNLFNQCNVANWGNIVSISAGYWHTVGLKADGTVVAVGEVGEGVDNYWGDLNVSDWNNIGLR